MALTIEQEQSLLALLNEKKITLSELPAATGISEDDLMLIRQGILDKSVNSSVMKRHFTPVAASLTESGITKLSNAVNSDDDYIAATSKAVKTAHDLAIKASSDVSSKSLSKSANLSDVTDVDAVLENLGLLEMLVPVGVPLPWPTSIPPSGWLKCNGASFNKLQYPQLALLYPSGMLPDLRGEFIRGVDDGRGVDVGRAILSAQKETRIGYFSGIHNPNPVAYNYIENPDSSTSSPSWGQIQAATLNPPVSGNTNYGVRPRNTAFLYIVRAA